MSLTNIVRASLMFLVIAPVALAQQPAPDDPVVRKALAIHARATTLDSHIDIFTTYATPADVEQIAKSGKRAIVIGMEDGYPMGTDLANLRTFYDLGARYLTLTHRDHNQLADSSSAPEPIHGGLSPLGRSVVAELNRLGMMIDVSHVSGQSFRDVIAITKAPIIASHSACALLTSSDRNLTDDRLRALARNGGVIQIAAVPNYIRAKDSAVPPSLEDFVDHVDHAAKVAGIDHVGIGSDFDGGGGVPGFKDVTEAPNVTIELVRRGYTEEQVRKIWGGNLLRVWREVEKTAAGLAGVK
jgi:membrane dipeptidase